MTAPVTRPRRILTIDGGGLRGVVAIAFLEEIERAISRQAGHPVPLRDHFDLIGGTSTGAIIATALALNMSLKELKARYFDLAPIVFRRRWNALDGVLPRFSAEDLEVYVGEITKERTLESSDLYSGGLAIVTKRLDTGSVWLLSNNPKAPFWGDADHVGNRNYALTSVVMASAAAPFYFSPQEIEIHRGHPPGLFVDGSLTPHNNPALAMFQLATIPAYGYGWATGQEALEITSVGCGSVRTRVGRSMLGNIAAGHAMMSLHSIMADCDRQVLTLMQALGHTPNPWPINLEIGDLGGFCLAPEPLFTFHRYDLPIDRDWLQTTLGASIERRQMRDFSRIDSLTAMHPLYDLAGSAAPMQVGRAFGGAAA